MNKLQELEKADAELKELGTRIEGIKFHLRSLENSLALLSSLRIQFSQNITVLKQNGIVPLASEYKKIRDDLAIVNNKLYVMRIDFDNHQLALERTEKFLVECQERYVILLRNQDGRVIKGNFGGKE
jgi:chromosome segregation ATPase